MERPVVDRQPLEESVPGLGLAVCPRHPQPDGEAVVLVVGEHEPVVDHQVAVGPHAVEDGELLALAELTHGQTLGGAGLVVVVGGQLTVVVVGQVVVGDQG